GGRRGVPMHTVVVPMHLDRLPGDRQVRSAREGARALHPPEGGVLRASPPPAPHRQRSLTTHCALRRYTGPVAMGALDREAMERVVERLHAQEPTFDWVGVYILEGNALVLGPFRGNPTEHIRIPLGQG